MSDLRDSGQGVSEMGEASHAQFSSAQAGTSATNVRSSGSRTETVTIDETETEETAPTVHLKLKKPKKKKCVGWTEETVDNEGMNKRKSKCCCIFKKPQVFGESSDSSDDDDDCDNCEGHKHHRNVNNNNNNNGDPPPGEPAVN